MKMENELQRALKAASKPNALQVDVTRYQAYLDAPELSPEEREEIIKALWTIISGFVALGFDVHPVQQACGEVEEPAKNCSD